LGSVSASIDTNDPSGEGSLLSYRVRGGAANVDQRLTVNEDGTVELDERHRSRDSISLQLDAAELRKLRAGLESVPEEAWKSPARLALGRFGHHLKASIGRIPADAGVRVTRGGRALGGRALEDPNVASLVEQLDEIRVRAVRSEPR
jgi:hypothetical protein